MYIAYAQWAEYNISIVLKKYQIKRRADNGLYA